MPNRWSVNDEAPLVDSTVIDIDTVKLSNVVRLGAVSGRVRWSSGALLLAGLDTTRALSLTPVQSADWAHAVGTPL